MCDSASRRRQRATAVCWREHCSVCCYLLTQDDSGCSCLKERCISGVQHRHLLEERASYWLRYYSVH